MSLDEQHADYWHNKYRDAQKEIALYKTPDIDLAKKIDHAVLANLLNSLKWVDRGDIHGKNVVTFQWIETTATTATLLYQISIPFSPYFSDYDSSIVSAAEELAKFLKQERKEVLVNLVLSSELKTPSEKL